ncbi:MAG: 2TM domain-containing protein [Methanobacterium sp.]
MVEENYEKAKKRVEELKGFYRHLISYVIIVTFLALVNFLTYPEFWWFLFVAFFWGIALIAHGLSTFTKGRLFSKDWEERKIREYMEEEEKE